MTSIKYTAFIFISVMLAAFFGFVIKGNAQQDTSPRESLSISPVSETYNVEAGEPTGGNVKVFNGGQTEYDFKVYAEPYWVSGEDYRQTYDGSASARTAADWISFSKTQFSIKPDETIEIPFTISTPDDAAPGGHYAIIFAETILKNEEQGTINRVKRVGSIAYMENASGEVIRSGKVLSFDAPFWQKNKPVGSSLRLENDGNTHFRAEGEVYVRNVFGIGSPQTTSIKGTVLPGTTRNFSLETENVSGFGLFRLNGYVNFLDETHQLQNQYVLLLPLSYIFGFVATLMAVIIGIVFLKRIGNKRTIIKQK